jgi:ABC-type phosphate/phosphonate transport system substrate-binding protein
MAGVLLGAVAYDPKVVTIWEGFRAWFSRRGFDLDVILFTNYERQVEAHLRGHIDVAWNSPLAWLQLERAAERIGRTSHAIAMRDTDRDLTSIVVIRSDSSAKTLADLRGRSVAVGAHDSPQATLIPLEHLRSAGLHPEHDVKVRYYDVLLGKHGDHIGGERDAARALVAREVETACMIDGNHLLFGKEGVLAPGATTVLAQTGPYDHCNFSILDDPERGGISEFRELLLAMSYDDPDIRPLMRLEGVRRWLPGRTSGYELLSRAIAGSAEINAFMDGVGEQRS